MPSTVPGHCVYSCEQDKVSATRGFLVGKQKSIKKGDIQIRSSHMVVSAVMKIKHGSGEEASFVVLEGCMEKGPEA